MRLHIGKSLIVCQFLSSVLFGAVTLSVSPSSISLSGAAGSTTPIINNSARVSAAGTGSGSLTVSVTPPSSWLTASAGASTITAGGAAVVITVTANPASLSAGARSGTVTITSG